MNLLDGREAKFLDSLQVRQADLNRDGSNEYLVISLAPDKCGSGGCDLLIYGRGPGGYRRLFGDGQDNWLVGSVNDPQVRLADTSTAGYTDLVVAGREHPTRLKFDGQRYRIVDFGRGG